MTLDTAFMGDTLILALGGIPMTLFLTLASLAFAIPLGFLIAVVRTNGRHPVASKVLGVYVSYTRGVPIIVQILIVYALLPDLVGAAISALGLGIDVYAVPNVAYAVFLFAFWSTAYFSEMFRSGLAGVGAGQYEAAVSNGLTSRQAYALVVAPQVFSASLPVMCTNVNNLIKMTALSFNMAVTEVTAIAKVAAGNSLAYLEAYLVAAAIYLVLCLGVELLFKVLERHAERKRSGVAASARSRKSGSTATAAPQVAPSPKPAAAVSATTIGGSIAA